MEIAKGKEREEKERGREGERRSVKGVGGGRERVQGEERRETKKGRDGEK